LINTARRILGEQFGQVLWIFPIIHLNFSNMQTFDKSFKVLAFWKGNSDSVHCNNHNQLQLCALRLVVQKLSYVLKSCWGKELFCEDVTIHSKNQAAVFEYSALGVEKEHRFMSVLIS
jgi:hypothetical protein